MLVIGRREVAEILGSRDDAVLAAVDAAYRAHDEGRSAVPHSVFLRFPADDRNRIIGLPAYVGGERPAAGMKWIASFPGNVERGADRATAVIVLNSLADGRPEALVEAGLISARRTAASAALAAALLTRDDPPAGVTVVGCGVISREILRFLTLTVPGLARVTVFDLDPGRVADFAGWAARHVPGLAVTAAPSLAAALAAHPLVAFATTAGEPHTDLAGCPDRTVVLHVSLRDLTPAAILAARNVVDDPDHVCRENTSLDLAQRLAGDRRFVDASIGALLRGVVPVPPRSDRPLVFSPFGLGALDIAVADLVRTEAERRGLGVRVDGFLPSLAPAAG